ncbi:hypothetical protein MNBD_ALPHA12-1457 [hydrothermal vent metagenome]|uniref:Flagellar biosynthesis protein FliO n=1 Tax=hydrothermal vent metagenome TaxID=652676 RepID=A0A3B0U018_9ZZZZ
MGFLTSIFGDGQSDIWTVILALAVVLVLIILAVWALKLVFKASGSISRGRQRRLAIVDTLVLDAKRSLILVRRDNVEHLIISNGTNDLVVESGIVTSETTSQPQTGQQARKPASTKRATKSPEKNKPSANGEQDAAAQRLGLSNILTRPKSAGTTRKEPPVYSKGQKSRPRNQEPTGARPGATSLRHTGLLRPTSEMETVFPLEERDNIAPQNNDSDMNELQQVDAQAMVSVEEGANPVNVDAQIKPAENEGVRAQQANIGDADEDLESKER